MISVKAYYLKLKFIQERSDSRSYAGGLFSNCSFAIAGCRSLGPGSRQVRNHIKLMLLTLPQSVVMKIQGIKIFLKKHTS